MGILIGFACETKKQTGRRFRQKSKIKVFLKDKSRLNPLYI
jgi:hypothetical protein